jgi:hypothetical protein
MFGPGHEKTGVAVQEILAASLMRWCSANTPIRRIPAQYRR